MPSLCKDHEVIVADIHAAETYIIWSRPVILLLRLKYNSYCSNHW